MNILNILKQVSIIVASLSGLITMVVTIRNMRQGRKERRSEYLERLLEKFSKNKVRELVCSYDSPDGLKDLYVQAREAGSREKRTLDEALLDMEHLCYLRQKKEVTDDEFCFFSDSIRHILTDGYIQRYIKEESCDKDEGIKSDKFRYIKKFVEENNLCPIDYSCDEKNHKTEHDAGKIEKKTSEGDIDKAPQEIRECDFRKPTMIIKINKLYQEGMNDQEVYEKVRKSWRVRPENANKYEVVLAVASGIVRGVYLIDKWQPTSDPDCSERFEFVRKEDDPKTEKEERDCFLGKSVRSLFPQGASNPIRYYAGRPSISQKEEC